MARNSRVLVKLALVRLITTTMRHWLAARSNSREHPWDMSLGLPRTRLADANASSDFFRAEGITATLCYFDPSYLIRSVPSDAEDSILCDFFARNAVRTAMAGKTSQMIGLLHDTFIHVPIELLASQRKSLDLTGPAWRAVLAATG